MREEDIDQVMNIWLNVNLCAHDFIHQEYFINHFSFVKEEIKKAKIYVYEYGDLIQGFAGITGTYIAGIFIREESQRKGFGKKLLDFLKKRYQELSLEVYEKNTGAVKFYLREDFKIIEKYIDQDTNEVEYLMKWNR